MLNPNLKTNPPAPRWGQRDPPRSGRPINERLKSSPYWDRTAPSPEGPDTRLVLTICPVLCVRHTDAQFTAGHRSLSGVLCSGITDPAPFHYCGPGGAYHVEARSSLWVENHLPPRFRWSGPYRGTSVRSATCRVSHTSVSVFAMDRPRSG